MKLRGLVAGKADFSVNWLEKSEDHFMQQYNKISLASKLKLHFRLADRGYPDLAAAVLTIVATEVGEVR
jgi:hypothetical protein